MKSDPKRNVLPARPRYECLSCCILSENKIPDCNISCVHQVLMFAKCVHAC